MTNETQETDEEYRRKVEESKHRMIKEEIAKINDWHRKYAKPTIDVDLIRREEAKGRQYLDSMFNTIYMRSEGTPILPRHTLIYGRLFDKIADKLKEIRAREQTPRAMSLDFLNTYSFSNCEEHYTYMAIFYGEKSK